MTQRRYIQLFFFILTLITGIRFYLYINNIIAGNTSVIRPNGVEGFLPISSLMSLKQLLLTGHYDMIHPAGLTLFITILLISIVFKKSFCSSICPVGFVSEMISTLGRNIRINKYISYALLSLKYLILIFFAYTIIYQMNTNSIAYFLNSPYNIVADAKMLDFFLKPSRTTLIVLSTLLVLTLIFTNFWCRFLCPYGALLGAVSVLSPFKVRRSKSDCIDCKRCTNACPMHISVHEKSTIHSTECIGCHECVTNRHSEKCLTVTKNKYYRYTPLIVTGIFFTIIVIAMVAGKWESKVPVGKYKTYIEQINRISH